jgi:pilus assembly protein Flp/PilA
MPAGRGTQQAITTWDPFFHQQLEIVMRNLCKSLVSFMKKEDGPTAVEYAVMLSLIIVVCIAAITTLGSNANQAFSFVGSNIKG